MSCTEVVEIDLTEGDPKLVVEGLVTDQPGPYHVRLTKTTSFYAESNYKEVPDAQVIMRDDTGNEDTLVYTSDGYYFTQSLQGVPGRTYFLEIVSEGKEYFSQSTLPAVAPIDSITVQYYNDTTGFLGQVGYFITFYAQEPEDTKNYYLWKIYRNGELQNDPDDVYIADDEVLGSAIQQPVFISYDYGDTARVEQYSLTKEAYDFYAGLSSNVNNDGGFFSSPPANPASNITGGALGLFQTSSVSAEEAVTK